MVDLEFLILDLWNLARRCLAEEYILIGVCSQPRYYATPHSWGSGIYFIHYPMLTHGAILCRPRTWAQDSARPWRAGIRRIVSPGPYARFADARMQKAGSEEPAQ